MNAVWISFVPSVRKPVRGKRQLGTACPVRGKRQLGQ